jgi:hypothetical protein
MHREQPPYHRRMRGRKNNMHNFSRVVINAVTIATLAVTARPLAAQTVAECYEKVLTMCDTALAASSWWEKPIVGAMCAGMLLGCNTTVVVNK